MTGNPDAENKTLEGADLVTNLYEAIVEEALKAYNNDPDAIPPYLRAAIENYLGEVGNPYEQD